MILKVLSEKQEKTWDFCSFTLPKRICKTVTTLDQKNQIHFVCKAHVTSEESDLKGIELPGFWMTTVCLQGYVPYICSEEWLFHLVILFSFPPVTIAVMWKKSHKICWHVLFLPCIWPVPWFWSSLWTLRYEAMNSPKGKLWCLIF